MGSSPPSGKPKRIRKRATPQDFQIVMDELERNSAPILKETVILINEILTKLLKCRFLWETVKLFRWPEEISLIQFIAR